jgi:iron(III) transport system ATP-binding protein/spermidine/putrescine transport system ATP-binding protein
LEEEEQSGKERKMNDAHIEFEKVSKRFGKTTALRDVSLKIPRGCFATLLGPSGCGKTTLLGILAGFHVQDAGEVRVNGTSVSNLPPEKRGTPLVFQDYALFPHMTVSENVGYGLRVSKTPKAKAAGEVERALDMFGLGGMGKRYPKELSGGQQQRVAFARALITKKDILLLDEPLSNLDAKLRGEVRARLRDIQRQSGITVVYVTHDQDEALAMSDYVAVMRAGTVEQYGPPREIYHRPKTRFVADFMGSANILPLIPGDANGRGLRFAGIHSDETPAEDDCDSCAVLRPEHVRVGAPSRGELTGTVEDSVFRGKIVEYRVRVRNKLLTAEVFDASRIYAPGERVGIAFDHDKAHVIGKERVKDVERLGTEHASAVGEWKLVAIEGGASAN